MQGSHHHGSWGQFFPSAKSGKVMQGKALQIYLGQNLGGFFLNTRTTPSDRHAT